MNDSDIVLVMLQEPKEMLWGKLVKLDNAGVIVRGINTRNFEEWSRQLASGKDPELGPATVFYPSHRIERVSLDEQIGTVPSVKTRFIEIVGSEPEEHFA